MKARSIEVTHRIMSSVKSKNTKPEIVFRKQLWKNNVRYRIHVNVFGKPDIAIKKYKIAIFVDGDFWHGNNWKQRGLSSLNEELKSYSDFWRNKIQRNIERDKEVNSYLEKQGWTVLRFWQSEIENNLNSCIEQAMQMIVFKKKSKPL